MNEGEKQALLTQVTVQINAAEKKIRALGLPFVKVGLFDERTRQPISDLLDITNMAEGIEPPEVRAMREAEEELRLKKLAAEQLITEGEGPH